MKLRIFPMLVVIACLMTCESAVAQGKGAPSWPDSTTFNLTSILGGDLFLSGDAFLLHMSGGQSLTGAYGIGVEIRLRPVFLGSVVGICGDEGIPNMHTADLQTHNTFFGYFSLYAGALVNNYRLEVGRTFGGEFDTSPHGSVVNYTSVFIGASRRYGTWGFVEPEVKIAFPIVGNYQKQDENYIFYPVTEHYHLSDVYIALSLKLGIGFDSYH